MTLILTNPLVPGLDDDVAPGIVYLGTGLQTGHHAAYRATGYLLRLKKLRLYNLVRPRKKSRATRHYPPGKTRAGDCKSSPIGTIEDHSNVLGQLHNSVDGLDSNDIKELAPFGHRQGSKYLSLTFEHDEFTDAGWGYTSDYRAITKQPEGSGSSWCGGDGRCRGNHPALGR